MFGSFRIGGPQYALGNTEQLGTSHCESAEVLRLRNVTPQAARSTQRVGASYSRNLYLNIFRHKMKNVTLFQKESKSKR